MIQKVCDEAVVVEALGSVAKVLPHEVLRKGKGRDVALFNHFEARCVPDAPAREIKDQGNVESRFVFGKGAPKRGNPDVELDFEEFEEGLIEDDVVGVM